VESVKKVTEDLPPNFGDRLNALIYLRERFVDYEIVPLAVIMKEVGVKLIEYDKVSEEMNIFSFEISDVTL
jgi:hypothetical protein